MSSKIGAQNSLLNTAASSFAQAIDKWLPGGTRPVFTKTIVLNTANLQAAGTAITLIPDPGAGNAILIKDYRLTLTDTPATNTGANNDGSAGLAMSAGGVISGVAGFSASGMTTGGTAGTAFTAYGGAATAQLRYGPGGPVSISGATAITNAFLQSAAPATFAGPLANGYVAKYGGGNAAVQFIASQNMTDVQAIVGNLVIVINYEIVSMRT